jgi:rRNA maturation endonuclease Nob1
MESLKLSEVPEISKFETIDNKKIIEINAKLDVLKLIGGIVDSLREGLTRELVVNGIKDEEILEEKLNKLEVIEEEPEKEAYRHYLDDVGEIEP